MKKLTDKQKHKRKIKIARNLTSKLKLTRDDETKIYSFANTGLFQTQKWYDRAKSIANRVKRKFSKKEL